MLEPNPPYIPDAWWQHFFILLIPGLIGYIEGRRYGTRRVSEIEIRIGQLDQSLSECHESMFDFAAQANKQVP